MPLREPERLQRADWNLLLPEVLEKWEPGDHFTILGPTKSGKSTMELSLAELRAESAADRGVVVLGTKPRDATLKGWIEAHKAVVVESWRDVDYQARKRRRIVVWPPYGRASTAPRRNKPAFIDVIDGVMNDGDWTLVVDETAYLVEQLGMRAQIDELWNAARSNGVTVMAGAQRGSWINRSMSSQMSWAAGFRFIDEDDAKRAAEIFGSRQRYTPILQNLKRHRFCLVQTVTGEAYDTVLPKPAWAPSGRPTTRGESNVERTTPGSGSGDPGRTRSVYRLADSRQSEQRQSGGGPRGLRRGGRRRQPG